MNIFYKTTIYIYSIFLIIKKNILKQNEGFTLIEVLVGINLTFIITTLIVSFYLFSGSFISAFSSRTLERQEVTNSLNYLFQMLRGAEDFEIKYSENLCLILHGDRDSIIIGNQKISIKNLYFIDNIEDITLECLFNNGSESGISIQNEPLDVSAVNFDDSISSQDISKTSLHFIKDKTNYDLDIVLPRISNRRFVNIKAND